MSLKLHCFKNNILNVDKNIPYGPGDLCSIPGRVIQRLQKFYLMPPCLTLSIRDQG